MMKVFQINKYLTLKLKDGKTFIYINKEEFKQCSYLLLNIPKNEIVSMENIASIDEAAEWLNNSMEVGNENPIKIPPEVEFWGHCSNLHAWAEHKYDPRLLHSNLSFPLLKKLTEVGDKTAKKVFKEEVAERFRKGNINTKIYLLKEDYITSEYFTKEETEVICEDLELEEFLKLDLEEALSLLWKITNLGIEHAKPILREKVIKLFRNQDYYQQKYILEQGYLTILSQKEINELLSEINTTKFKSFIMRTKPLEAFPKYLLQFSKLRSLSYGGNSLKRFPEEICELTELEVLEYDYNNIKEFPECIGNLTKLESLDLSYNNLTELPEAFAKLENLRELNLNNNDFETFPEPLTKLSNLERLQIMRTKNLKKLSINIGNLKNLRTLILSYNSITELPESIGNLKKLEKLYLGNNNLETLPESIGKMNNLKKLYLNNNNKIKKLPDSIGGLKNLRMLDLSDNNLETLPESIGNLIKLRELHLCYNNLRELPESIKNLQNLYTITIHHNTLNPYEYYLKYNLPVTQYVLENKEFFLKQLQQKHQKKKD